MNACGGLRQPIMVNVRGDAPSRRDPPGRYGALAVIEFSSMKRGFWWLFALLLAPASRGATDLGPQDFAFGAPVLTTSVAAGYRFALPLAVYRDTDRDDLGDLRVFNAQGEAVPYSSLRTEPEGQAHAPSSALLPLPSSGAAVNQTILDARAVDAAISALQLDWLESASDYSGRVKIDVSDDMNAWQTLVEGAPVANLHNNGRVFKENHVALAPTKARFWRITWVGPPPPFALTSVLAEPADSPAEAARASLEANGASDPADPDVYAFDLGAHPPTSRVSLMLPETNMVSSIELYSRRTPRDPWRFIARGNFYRITTAEGEQHGAPLRIAVDRDRYWRARINHGGGDTRSPPRLKVEWQPSEVTFLARGQGPFLLAFGSASAVGAEADLGALPAATEIASASLGAIHSLGGPSRLDPKAAAFPWVSATLRAVSILGTVLLGWIALRLYKNYGNSRTR
jgi:hypothetical protein